MYKCVKKLGCAKKNVVGFLFSVPYLNPIWSIILCDFKKPQAQKDSDLSLVSNENFSEILWPSGLALGQVTWAKMAQKLLHLWRHSQKNLQLPTKKFFIECRLEDCRICLSPWTALWRIRRRRYGAGKATENCWF